jgi:hypothetical protein
VSSRGVDSSMRRMGAEEGREGCAAEGDVVIWRLW